MTLGEYIQQLLLEGWVRKPGLMSLVAFGASDINLCHYNDYLKSKKGNETFEEWQMQCSQLTLPNEIYRGTYFQKG